MDTVQPLQEDRTALIQVLGVFPMATSVSKFMAKFQPLCLH